MAAILDKIQADKAEEKANSQRGLGALLKALFGGLTGFVTGGGPVGALIGAGSGLVSGLTGGAVDPPAKDMQSALTKFQEWQKSQPTYQASNLSGQQPSGWADYKGFFGGQ
jgi:hypothetical protein